MNRTCSANDHTVVKQESDGEIFRIDRGSGVANLRQRRGAPNMLDGAMVGTISKIVRGRGRSYADWVRAALNRKGLSQAEMSRQMGTRLGRKIDRAALNKLVSGNRGLLAEEMLVIAEITGRLLPPVPGGGTVSLNRAAPAELSEVDWIKLRLMNQEILEKLGVEPDAAELLITAMQEFSLKQQDHAGDQLSPDQIKMEARTLLKLFSTGRRKRQDPDSST